jgi:iron complex outermembrane receptor protein
MSVPKYLRRVAAAVCLAARSAYADEVASEQDYLQDFPVVLSASRLSQPLSEAPNAMTVIDRKMIEASGFRNIADVFSLVPGMYVSYYKGSQPIVAYHGSTDQYARSMQVMIDGRSVYMPPTSTVDWASLPITIDDIERIEVIRGPAAASYGANSVQGVISIITKDAGALNGTRVSWTNGNKGINDVTGQFGRHGDNFDYRMTVAKVADNGFDNRTATYLPSPFGSNLNNSNDSNQARLANYRATYYANSRNNFDVQLGGTHDVQGVGFIDSHGGTNPFHDLISKDSFQQLTWLHLLEDTSELKVSFSHTRNAYQENYVVPQFGNAIVNKSTSGERTAFEVQHTVSLSDTNRLVYGAGINDEQAADNVYISALVPSTLNNQLNVQSVRVFAQDEWRFAPSLIGNLGAMFENDGLGGKKLSPRASLNYHVTPKQTFRIGGSVAYRTPSLVEDYGTAANAINFQVGDRFVVGNTSLNLTPERMFSREIGYLTEIDEWATTVDVRVFNDQFDNTIYPTNVGFRNGLSGQYDGVETTLKHSFSAAAQVTLNYAHEFARSNANALMPGSGDLLAGGTPLNTISMLYMQSFDDGYSLSTGYYQQGALQSFDRGPADYQNMYKRVDVRVAKAFRNFAGLSGDVAWVVQNLFNDNYSGYVGTNVFNQRTYVKLTLGW